jgi:hypothetical protein
MPCELVESAFAVILTDSNGEISRLQMLEDGSRQRRSSGLLKR